MTSTGAEEPSVTSASTAGGEAYPSRRGTTKPTDTQSSTRRDTRRATKVKKLTTLADKSVMDWKAHVQSSESAGLQDELEANRRLFGKSGFFAEG